MRLLPTPRAVDETNGDSTQRVSEELRQEWLDFEPAIRRQEALSGRAAPIPTEVAPRGDRRLTARFAEWLMWLPAGWVTDVPGLSRSKHLHKIGNGVVPAQAHEAYRWLLADYHKALTEERTHGS